MILNTFIVLLLLSNLGLVATKGLYKKVIDNHAVFNKILSEGLYHVTTKENAEKIMTSGVLNSTNPFFLMVHRELSFLQGVLLMRI